MNKTLDDDHDLPPLVILIEDDPDHAELMQRSMSKPGLVNRILHLRDGKEALDALFGPNRLTTLPKLILLDLNLPKIDGWQVLKNLKESEYAVVPVVILSSSSNPADITRSSEMHANSYVPKPSRLKGYTDLAHDLSAYWLGWNELGPTSH